MIFVVFGVLCLAFAVGIVYLGAKSQGGGHGHSHNHGHGHSHDGNNKDSQHKKMAENYKSEKFNQLYKEAIVPYRGLCLEPLKSIKPSAIKGAIRIVEIGAGPGLNLEYYPKNTKLVVVDPNPYFTDEILEKVKKFPGIELEKHVSAGAENMSEIPDKSVDAVVSTMVMCQIKDHQKTYKEIQRILVPGGKLYFMDHVADPTSALWRIIQTIGSYWNERHGTGGRGDHDIETAINRANFDEVKLKRFELKIEDKEASAKDKMKYRIVRHHVYGTAATAK